MRVGEAISLLNKNHASPFLDELKTHKKKDWLVEVKNTDGSMGFVVIKDSKHNRKLFGLDIL